MTKECPTPLEAQWIAEELWLLARRYPPNQEQFYRAVSLLLLPLVEAARAVAPEAP
jgi:hypothetical protein